ncbi:membrane protein [Clostridia bacterium]|nr:membrane protein [Clostridia bacterium]
MSIQTIVIPLIFLALFVITYRRNRTSLLPGFFLTICFFISLFFFVIILASERKLAVEIPDIPGSRPIFEQDLKSTVISWILFLIIALTVVLVLFGIYVLIAYLLLNARSVLKKERFRLSHCIGLLLAVVLIIHIIFNRIVSNFDVPYPVVALRMGINFVAFFLTFHLIQFTLTSILCNCSRPRYNQDYIIVHGAGLKDGKDVTPLLAGRVDRAIAFYRKQVQKTTAPKLILSGGQGGDELRSEAKAMEEYALSCGIPESDILLEEQSTTTYQNMCFSKELMDRVSDGKAYRAIYATNNYHLLRTGIYARKAGLKISGIGSKTARYYLPIAFLREYAAYINLHRKLYVSCYVLFFLAGVLLP